jgi:REP element-mobilizing transposase RayT
VACRYLYPIGYIKHVGKKSSAVYNINYHVAWCSKFRKPILVDKVKKFVEEQLESSSSDIVGVDVGLLNCMMVS